MSTIFRILWELLFLVLHPKGPIMSIVAACRYLRESEGWANSVIKQYKRFGHVDFSEERGPKRVTTKAQDLSSQRSPQSPRQRRRQLKVYSKRHPSQQTVATVARRLKENHVRWKALLKKAFCPKSKSWKVTIGPILIMIVIGGK